VTRGEQEADADRPVYLLTGAGGALGSAFCRRFSSRYQIVAVWHRRRPVAPSQGQKLVDPLQPRRSLPVNRHPVFDVQTDLRSDADVERLVKKVVNRFGRIDVVINAAVAGRWTPLLNGESVTDDFAAALRVNVVAPLAVVAEVTRQCWGNDVDANRLWNRNVVNVSSSAGFYVYPGYGQGMYSAGKAALNILTRHLAAELEPLGVRANAIAPDSFPSRVPIRRVLDGLSRLAEGDLTGQVLLQLPANVEYTLAQ
jgi:NAD(P)-dependent dehydrogenase (short-subunit alcohol dehydrogenase family)